MKKRIFSILLCLCMVLMLCPVTALANGDATELQNRLNDGGTVTLDRDYTIDTTLSVNNTVTLDLNGYVIRKTGNGSVFKVYGTGRSLTLQDSDPDAKHDGLPDGGVITGGNSGNGGGVYVAEGGRFTMEGGTIYNCSTESGGGGVFVGERGSFTMNGGAIKDCYVTGGPGGGVFVGGGSFTMTSGVIEGCYLIEKHLGSGAVACNNISSMTANGGVIKGSVNVSGTITNTSTDGCTEFYGEVTNGGTISGGIYYGKVMNKGTISGGIYYGGIVNDDDGTISGKTVTFKNGESIYAREVVADGATAVAPIEPASPNGEKCLGWYADGESTPYDFSKPVNGNITLTAQWFTNHDLKHIPAKAPTPTEDGNIEYWVCKNCCKWFADKDGKEGIKDKSSVIVPSVTVEIPFTTTVKLGGSEAPGKTTFELALIDGSGNELKHDGMYFGAVVTTNGAGSYEGTMTFKGTFQQLQNMLGAGVFVQQVNAGEPNWTYDDTVWGVRLENKETAVLAAADDAAGYTLRIYPATLMTSGNGSYYVIDDENPVDEMQFTNTYTYSAPVRDTATIVIGGGKEENKPVEENPNTGAPVAANMSTLSVLTLAAAAVAVLKTRKR